MLGRGHGTRFLWLLAQRLRSEGAPAVAIDPDVRNVRARRAYENAGFRTNCLVATAQGPAVLMIFDAQTHFSSSAGDKVPLDLSALEMISCARNGGL